MRSVALLLDDWFRSPELVDPALYLLDCGFHGLVVRDRRVLLGEVGLVEELTPSAQVQTESKPFGAQQVRS